MFGKRFSRALVVTTAASLVMATAVFADNTGVDGDDVVAGASETYSLDLGEVCADGTVGGSVDVFARRTGSGTNVFQNSATVTFSVHATAGGASAILPASPGNQVTLPSNWTSLSNNSVSDSISASVSYTAGAALGPASGTITFRGTGLNGSNNTINRDATLTLTADVITCGTTNSVPVISSAAFAGNVACRVASTLNVNFTDADAGDTHTATVDWDDGSAVENLGAVTSPFSATHTYTSPGSYTATVTVSDGTDSASEEAGITVGQTYTVSFLQPLNGSSTGNLVGNTFKNGRVLPVKATIYDDCTLTTVDGSSSITPTIKLATSALSGGADTDAVEEYADAGQSNANTNQMRWSDDGFWIYNLDSKALGMKSGSHYRLNIFMGSTQATTSQWVILSPQK